ncbi:MAG: integrase family protein [Methylophilaceae bacterium]|nr:integrase family protein [Methylophilaceae bacterium]
MTSTSQEEKVVLVKKKFTADVIASFECKAGKSQTIYWDAKTSGLGLRVTATGAKSYIFETSLNNKTMRITIGDIRTYSIKAAQVEATNLKAMTDKGIDPRQVKADNIANDEAKAKAKTDEAAALVLKEQRQSITLGKVWLEYIAERKEAKEGKEKSWSDRHYKDHVKMIHGGGVERKRSDKLTEAAPLASLAKLKLVDITAAKVTEWADDEANRRPTQARLAFRLLRAFLSWCKIHPTYGLIVTDNAAKNDIARKRLGKPQTKNDVLQREQLPAWFTAVKQINNPVINAYLQTLLLTGRRREQIAQLKWTDIDFQWNKITMKDKTEHNPSIPLTPYVAHLLQSLPRRNQFVFSSLTAKAGYLADPSDAHRKACAEAGVELTLHGLRRSFATLCEWTETPAGIAAQIQGHAPQGVRENNYIRRPLDLLRMWHVKIEAWMLEQANIKFEPVTSELRVIKTA